MYYPTTPITPSHHTTSRSPLPSTRHIDIPWHEFYTQTTKTTTSTSRCCSADSLDLDFTSNHFSRSSITSSPRSPTDEDTLSARDSYILLLHARARDTITPSQSRSRSRLHRPSNLRISKPTTSLSRNSSPHLSPRRPSSPSSTILLSTPATKRFKRPTPSQHLSRAVLLKNSFEAAARTFESEGKGFAAAKQRRRARLPTGFIVRVGEGDDVGNWTFPEDRAGLRQRGDWRCGRRSSLGVVSVSV